MKANELRIGNLLYYKNTVDVAMVEIIHKKHFDCRDKYGTFTPNGRYEPITLTEEWLLKMGAKEVGIGTNLFEFDRFYLRWHPQFNYWYVTEVQNNAYITKVEFVHEWQNVVFVLNGKELEVNP